MILKVQIWSIWSFDLSSVGEYKLNEGPQKISRYETKSPGYGICQLSNSSMIRRPPEHDYYKICLSGFFGLSGLFGLLREDDRKIQFSFLQIIPYQYLFT